MSTETKEITAIEKKDEGPLTPKKLFNQDNIKRKFEQLLGSRAQGFITSVLQIISTDKGFANVDPYSVYNAAAIAATLDLPINKNLGFAWIIAYGGQAQFQIGYRGYVQLAQRTGQYAKMNVIEIYESQFKSWNPLTEEFDADFNVAASGPVVGYCAYFEMLNGFKKTIYWSAMKVNAHAVRFSRAVNSGPWKTDTYEMGKKTVLKNMLNKWGYLSIEMQTAMKVDQAVIKDDSAEEVEYIDHEVVESTALKSSEQSEQERVEDFISKATTIKELASIKKKCGDDLFAKVLEKWEDKAKEISDKLDAEQK